MMKYLVEYFIYFLFEDVFDLIRFCLVFILGI